MDIAQRLSRIIKDLGQSPASFADEIGVQRSGISHIISGRNKPSLEFLEKLHQRFPTVDLVYLITGSPGDSTSKKPDLEKKELPKPKEVKQEVVQKAGKKAVIILYEDGSFEDFHPK